jgi:hypothetical protein
LELIQMPIRASLPGFLLAAATLAASPVSSGPAMPAGPILTANAIDHPIQLDGAARGSIADVQAKGVWRDGRWHLDLSRLLDTGHDDAVVIPADGTIPFAVALLDAVSNNVVDGGAHSVSDLLVLETRAASS